MRGFLFGLAALLLSHGAAAQEAGRCAAPRPMADVELAPRWTSWGADYANSRFQPAAMAGITAADVPKLKLKWAIGFPDTSHAWSQPTVAGGRVFVGSQGGRVFALDAKSGCVIWTFQTEGATRTAVTDRAGAGREHGIWPISPAFPAGFMPWMRKPARRSGGSRWKNMSLPASPARPWCMTAGSMSAPARSRKACRRAANMNAAPSAAPCGPSMP